MTLHPDTTARYGTLSRFFHWSMAAGIGWVLLTALTHALAAKSALDALLWPTHKHVGSVLMVMIVLRILWLLLSARQRPPSANLAARLGHWALYALMLLIPLVALLRQHGSGRAFAPLGLPIFQAHDDKVQWMVHAGNTWHGLLGWVLLALVIGHVGMALLHRRNPAQDVLPRMIR